MNDLQVYDFGILPNRWTKTNEIFRDGCVKPNRRQVGLCVDWLERYAMPAKSKCCPKSSYFLKHVVEREYGEYVTNGALIEAALSLGFEFEHKPNSINIGIYLNLPRWVYKPQGRN